MANILSANTYYVDTASAAADAVDSKDVQIVGIIFSSATALANFTINDTTTTAGALAVGSAKFKGSIEAASQTLFLDLASCPIRCANGIWVSAISSGTLTLILKFK